jgi:uncharacterized membrane protein
MSCEGSTIGDKLHLEKWSLHMYKARLSPEAITKLRNYTGFSPIELLIVIAVIVCWPRTPVGYSRSAKIEL